MQYTSLQPNQSPTFGTSGDAVKQFQSQLNSQNQGVSGYTPIQVDGFYGPLTQQASQFNSTSKSTPKVSTTTLSNTNKMEQIPGMVKSLSDLSNKGITTDATGTPKYADGTIYQETTSADTTSEDDATNKLIDSMKENLDAQTKSLVDNIQQKFALRKSEQEDINRRTQGGINNALLMGGVTGQGSSAQYAPISSQGIVSATESYGIKQLAALDADEQDAIAQAKQAQTEGNYKILQQKLDLVEKKRQEKLDFAKKLNEQILEANKKKSEQNLQIQKEDAITKLYNQGVTDPNKIADQLRKSGYNATLKEVKDATDLLSGIGGSGIIGEYNFYKSQALAAGQVPMDFNQYQNADANRKASAANGTTVDENGNVIETGNYDALTIGRYNKAVNSATAILQKNPTFKNIIGSSAYLDRIEAAVQNPGSVGDQELLDAFTQLNTGGNRVTEAQVHLITGNQSLSDLLNKAENKLKKGGALSNGQRQEIVDLAHEVYKKYQASYKPLYEDAVKRLEAQGIPKEFWNIPSPDTLSRAVSDTEVGTTGDSIIQDETQAENTLKAYKDSNPTKIKEIDTRIKAMEKALGRPANASEFLQAFPEYKGNFSSVGGDTNIASVSIPSSSNLAFVNNNPGNLRYVGQAGATPGKGRFAKFESAEAGAKALVKQIALDASRGHTLLSFISKYAPPSENDTKSYINNVAKTLGVSTDTKIANINIKKLAQIIAQIESGAKIV